MRLDDQRYVRHLLDAWDAAPVMSGEEADLEDLIHRACDRLGTTFAVQYARWSEDNDKMNQLAEDLLSEDTILSPEDYKERVSGTKHRPRG